MEISTDLIEEYGLESIVESIQEGLWIYDRSQKKYIFFSDSIEKIYQRSFLEFQENLNLWTEVIYKEDQKIFEKSNVNLLKQGVTESKYRIELKDKTIRWVKDKRKLLRDSSHFPRWVIGTVIDITDSFKEKNELSEADVSFQILFHENITPMCIYDVNSLKILEVNSSIIKVLGYRYDEFLEKSILDLILNEDRKAFSELLDDINSETPKTTQESFRFLASNGSKKHFLVLCFSSVFHGKKSVICLFFDKTESILYEQKIHSLAKNLEEQNQNLKKIAFLNAHQIRGPLTNLLSLIDIIKRENKLNIETINDLQNIANTLDRSIKDISQTIKQGAFKEFSEITLLSESSILHIDDDILQLKITQALLSSLKNEIKYLPYFSPLVAIEDLVSGKIFPDLIFLDLNMDECNGWEFLEEMKKKQLSFPVVIVSSTINIEDYEKSKTYNNVKGFICKPLSLEKLQDLLFIKV